MKKFISGVIVGALIFGAIPGVYAASKSFVGKKIATELTVYFNGKKLDDAAIVAEGKSYLPVRKMAELSGLTLELKGSEIYLKSKGAVKTESNATTPTPTLSPALKKDYEERLEQTKKGIAELEKTLAEMLEVDRTGWPDDVVSSTMSIVEGTKNELARLYANKAEYEAKLGITSESTPTE